MIPGIRKSEKGVLFSIANGNPPNNFPEGERIKAPPPPIAPRPNIANKPIRMFRERFNFMV